MKEYIERERLKEAFNADLQTLQSLDEHTMNLIFMEIDEAPAADVVEVRHGRWIGLEYDGYADGCPVYDLWECSECGEEVRGEDVPSTHLWCHSCGTRMDKEDEIYG